MPPAMNTRRRQMGVGLVEVLIGALILAFVVTGTAVLLGDWLPAVSDSNNRVQAINRNVSVMEVARYEPVQSSILDRISGMEMSTPASTFTVTAVSVTPGDGSDAYSATVVWTDPYLDSSSKTRSFSLSSSVPDDNRYAGLADLVTTTPQLTVSTNAGPGTTISPASQDVLYGARVDFEVTLQTGYQTLGVVGCNGNLIGSTYRTGFVVSDCTVESSAMLDTTDTDGDGVYDWQDVCPGQDDNSPECGFAVSYTVTPVADPGTTISPQTDPGSGTAPRSFEVALEAGYENLSVSSDCGGSLSGSTYTTDTITQNCTVTVTADPTSYTVSTNVGEGTTISPTSRSVAYGGTTTFSITQLAGYGNLSATGCGGTLTGTNYTTGAITGDCVVTSSAIAESPWSGVISLAQVHSGSTNNKDNDYAATVTFSPSQPTCAYTGDGGYTCTSFTTTEAAVTASISVGLVSGSQNTICSVSPSTLTLTEASPSGTFTITTAYDPSANPNKNPGQCP